MVPFLLWWLVASLIGLAAFPLIFRLLPSLPDRGYAAAKPLGLLLTTYLFWIGGSVGLFGNTIGSIAFVTLLVLAGGLLLGVALGPRLREFARTNWRYLLAVELIFLAVFAWLTFVRSYAPDIAATEKPFELAFLNGVSRTPYFPPVDTWYSGFAMNYYYFGYASVHVLASLTGQSNGIAFNLATPLTGALASVTIFGLVYGLVRGLSSSRVGARRAIIAGFASIGLLMVVSSLEGVLEMLAAHGSGSPAFYQAVGIQGLTGARTASAWYSREYWWWWRATRMGSGWNIMEFPFFSFLLADLHPHVMVIPFALLALTFIWGVFAGSESLDGRWWRRNPLLFLVFAAVLGLLAGLNAWDQPTDLLILLLVTAFANARRLGGWDRRTLIDTLLFTGILAVASVLLFLPFWLVEIFHKPDFVGIAPTIVSTLPSGDLKNAMATPFLHLLLFWGVPLWLSFSLLAVHLRRSHAISLPARYVTWPLAAACLPLLGWLVMATARLGLSGVAIELGQRGSNLLTVLCLTVLVFLALSALLREALPNGHPASGSPVLFALIAVTVGLLFLQNSELFYVVEASLPPVRANTVFKFWYQAWILQSIGGAFGLAYLLRDWRPRLVLPRPLSALWGVATALLILAALVYAVAATFNRTSGFSGHRSLDGLAFWHEMVAGKPPLDAADYNAAMWLASHAQGMPVLLEAEGVSTSGQPLATTYTLGGRISELSGLPTVLAWADHERQFRNNPAQVDARDQAIRTIYTTSSLGQARTLLAQYHVRYVIVGQLEREVYGDTGLAKFAQLGAPVYHNPSVTIYDVTQPLPLGAAAGSGP